jgi:hypothetical protein
MLSSELFTRHRPGVDVYCNRAGALAFQCVLDQLAHHAHQAAQHLAARSVLHARARQNADWRTHCAWRGHTCPDGSLREGRPALRYSRRCFDSGSGIPQSLQLCFVFSLCPEGVDFHRHSQRKCHCREVFDFDCSHSIAQGLEHRNALKFSIDHIRRHFSGGFLGPLNKVKQTVGIRSSL